MNKNMTKVILTVIVTILAFVSVTAQDKKDNDKSPKSGMIFGQNHAYTLTAPKGWAIDSKSGAAQGLAVVFYPETSSWKDSVAVIYANVWQKDAPAQTVKDVIDKDIVKFKNNSPGLKIEDAASIDVGKGKTATVKLFLNDAYGNHEAVAYIEEEKLVIMIVLTSRAKKDFDASLPAFREIVGSYSFVTDKVVIEK